MKRLYMTLQGDGRCRCCSSCLWGKKEVGISLDPQMVGQRAKCAASRSVPKLSAALLPAVFPSLTTRAHCSSTGGRGRGRIAIAQSLAQIPYKSQGLSGVG